MATKYLNYGVIRLKKTVPLFLLLLLLCGCTAQSPAQAPTQLATSDVTPMQPTPFAETPTPSSSPSPQKLQHDWHYDQKSDGVYRTDQNTGEVIKISDSDDASSIIIIEDGVYFRDNGHLYRMDNENKKELISSEACWQLQLSGDMLYYKNSSGVNRMNLDGSGNQLIFPCEFVNMVITDQYVFYILDVPINDDEEHSDDGPPLPIGELHRVDLDGKNDVNLGVLITDLSDYKNLVYFSDSSDNYLYSMNPETLDKIAVYKGYWIEEPYFGSDYVFFDSDHVFYRLSLTKGTLTELTKAFGISCSGILDGYVYVDINTNDPDVDGLYRIRIDGVNLEKVE